MCVSIEITQLKKHARKTQAKRVKKTPGTPEHLRPPEEEASKLVVPEHYSTEVSEGNLQNLKVTKIVRKGLKNSRVLVNGVSQLIPNEKLAELLARDRSSENTEGVG